MSTTHFVNLVHSALKGLMGERKGLASFIAAHNDENVFENIVSDITQLIGWTPLIELKNIAKKEDVFARVVAKLESYQPLTSVKDRAALRMIEDAEKKGLITPGVTTLVEYTSGNLGIALAYIGLRKGYKFIAVMPNHYSAEKRMLMKYLGADVSITDSKLGDKGAFDRIKEIMAKNADAYVLDQFDNPANPGTHVISTGPEIWKDTGGKINILVCGVGSGGTISGVSKYLRTKNPALEVICVEPAENPIISGGEPGHHNIQGIGAFFIPNNFDRSCYNEVITVTTEEAMVHARRLAKEEGLLVGISSGANLAASLKVARRPENKGKMIVTVFASSGVSYMSTELFDEVREDCVID